MRQITITQLGFSPDKMERVVLTYAVKEENDTHAKVDTVELPRVTYTKKYDKETHTSEEVPVNALKGGHFTSHFKNRAVKAVIEHFYPAEEVRLKKLTDAVKAIKHAATEVEESPKDIKKTVSALQKALKAAPALTDDLQAAWLTLEMTRARIHAFGRGAKDEEE